MKNIPDSHKVILRLSPFDCLEIQTLGRMTPHIHHHLMMGNRADWRDKGLVLHLLSPKRSNNEKVTVN